MVAEMQRFPKHCIFTLSWTRKNGHDYLWAIFSVSERREELPMCIVALGKYVNWTAGNKSLQKQGPLHNMLFCVNLRIAFTRFQPRSSLLPTNPSLLLFSFLSQGTNKPSKGGRRFQAAALPREAPQRHSKPLPGKGTRSVLARMLRIQVH